MSRIKSALELDYPGFKVPVDTKDLSKGLKEEATDEEYIREVIRRFLVEKTRRYEENKAREEVRIASDNNLIK